MAADQHFPVPDGRAREPRAHLGPRNEGGVSAGKFLPAYRREAAADNERNEVWIDHEGQTVVCRQVVGILARRIVCRVTAGTELQAGQRFGVMKFGSRIDLYVPPASTLRVAVGDRVRSGVTVLATLPATRGDR